MDEDEVRKGNTNDGIHEGAGAAGNGGDETFVFQSSILGFELNGSS